jgi:outer membrane protein assembly factor BamB
MRTHILLVASLPALCDNWPAWRGPDGLGTAPESLPTRWSRTENVKWRIDLPGPGNSTPIVWGDRIYLTQPKPAGVRALLAVHRATGKQLWESSVRWEGDDPTHATNPHASASPATDGERVVAWFGSAGIVAYEAATGKELWRRDLGRQRHTWGYASSPVIHGDRVFLNFGPGDRAFLVAVDKKTGKTLWQVDEPSGQGIKFANWDPKDMYGSWSTPLVTRDGDRDVLLVTHPRKLAAHDPATGAVLWSAEGMGDLVYPSPVVGRTAKGDRVVVAPSGFQGPSMVVRMGGSGDVTSTHRLWHTPKSKNFIGSGAALDGYLYWVDTTGVAQAVELASGEVMWTQRISPEAKDGAVWSSVVRSGSNLYVNNKSGHTVVFKANPRQFEVVAVNSVEEVTNSSVVVAGGDILIRTHAGLWCIGR